MCKEHKCKRCPYRHYEKSDVFRTTPVCELQCKDTKARKVVTGRR